MHPIVYYILIFLAIGAVGMAVGNKHAEPKTRKQRWLKYFTYIIFTGVVVLGIFFNFIIWIAVIIVAVSFIELFKVSFSKSFSQIIVPILVFALVATGFIFFTSKFQYSFLLFIYLQVLVFDGFCQITGQLIGKRQLAPSISVAKTVEGLIGGFIFCLIAAMMSANWVRISLPVALLCGLITGLSSFAGDMLASWYKRKANVKDYSNWLPGQGGFLDRFDSFLVTGMVYYFLLIVIFKERSSSLIN